MRQSTNGGATWQTVETFQLSSGKGAGAFGIGADAANNLYVVGNAGTPSGSTTAVHWIVRKSTDSGNSWNTVDDFQQSSSNVAARRFAVTSNGDLYVAGIASSSTGNHWIVRKNPAGTGTWSTIDDYQYVAGASTEPYSMAADTSGNLFAGGTGGGHWLIKKY